MGIHNTRCLKKDYPLFNHQQDRSKFQNFYYCHPGGSIAVRSHEHARNSFDFDRRLQLVFLAKLVLQIGKAGFSSATCRDGGAWAQTFSE